MKSTNSQQIFLQHEPAQARKTRSMLIIDIANLVLEKYPVAWKSAELSIATGTNRRTVERVLADMTAAELLEKRDGMFTLNIKHINQIYGAKWYVRLQTDKDILLAGRKRNNNNKKKGDDKNAY